MPEHTRSGSTTEQAKQAAQRAQAHAGEAMDQAGNKADQYVDKAENLAKGQASQRKNQAAGAVSDIAGALRKTGDQLRQQNQGMYAMYADEAADRIDNFAGYLRGQNINDLIDQAEQFGRDQPLLMIGGAFALGMLGARFLKASRPQPEREYRTSDIHSHQTNMAGYRTSSRGSAYPTTYGAGTPSPDANAAYPASGAGRATPTDFSPSTNPAVSGDTPTSTSARPDYSDRDLETRRDHDATR
jgi:ElaB/YqjD/DUF883 family membrane-anchored ribosome-binding protein